MKLPMSGSMSLPINMRKFLIERYVDQKQKEHEAMEAAQKKGKRG